MFANLSRLPGAVVFDLDDTLWEGEVDCSGGPPFTQQGNSRDLVLCSDQRPIRLFRDVPKIFDTLIDLNVPIAYASRTWEPSWAIEALKKFTCGPELQLDMWTVCSFAEWGNHSKVSHIRTVAYGLKVPIESMLFFDNEMRNLRDIAPLGATCGFCPHGMTMEIFRTKMFEYSNKTP